jgi:hypothetical protein
MPIAIGIRQVSGVFRQARPIHRICRGQNIIWRNDVNTVHAVSLNGLNQHLAWSSQLISSDTQNITLVLYLKVASLHDGNIINIGNLGNFFVRVCNDGSIWIRLRSSNGGLCYECRSKTNTYAINTFGTIMFSVRTISAQTISHFWWRDPRGEVNIETTAPQSGPLLAPGLIDTDSTSFVLLGNYYTFGFPYSGTLGPVYFANEYCDLSQIHTRNAFCNSLGFPIYIGKKSSFPTGRQPEILHTWAPGNVLHQDGTMSSVTISEINGPLIYGSF